jgi:hypothetical protein
LSHFPCPALLGRLGKFFDPLLIFKGFLKTTYSRTSPAHYFFRGKGK